MKAEAPTREGSTLSALARAGRTLLSQGGITNAERESTWILESALGCSRQALCEPLRCPFLHHVRPGRSDADRIEKTHVFQGETNVGLRVGVRRYRVTRLLDGLERDIETHR